MTEPHAYVFLADRHGGSRYAPWRLGGRREDGLDGVRDYLNECDEHCRTVWLPSVIGNMPFVVELCGDIIDGVSPKSEMLTDDEEEQVAGTVALLRPWCEGATQVRGVKGTEFHTGKSGKWDRLALKLLGATPDENGNYARTEDWIQDGPMMAHIAHHIGISNVIISRATPLTREYENALVAAAEAGWPMPTHIIRAHSHFYRTVPYGPTDVVTLPGWQGKTGYVNKRHRGAPFSVGAYVLIVDGEKVEPRVKLYKWPVPRPEVITNWQNPNRSSATTSGPTFSGAIQDAASRVKKLMSGKAAQSSPR